MEILDFFKNHWLAIAFLAPLFWAMVNIIDVYFVDGIYKDEVDGAMIAGLFQIAPWIIILIISLFRPVVDFSAGLSYVHLLSFFAGIMYIASFYFYFKALFNKNDVSLLQIVWNLTVIAVPLLSFLLLGEILPLFKYVGLALVLGGATLLSFNPKLRASFSKKYLFIMLGAVFFLSLSMILQEQAYNILAEAHGSGGFWQGFFFFGFGAFLAGIFMALIFKRRPWLLIKRYYKIFFLGEGVYFLGTMFSQKALDIAPSVSYVAVVETFTPVFILIYSLLILGASALTFKAKNEAITRVYSGQIQGIWVKVIATIIMAGGVYVIS